MQQQLRLKIASRFQTGLLVADANLRRGGEGRFSVCDFEVVGCKSCGKSVEKREASFLLHLTTGTRKR